MKASALNITRQLVLAQKKKALRMFSKHYLTDSKTQSK